MTLIMSPCHALRLFPLTKKTHTALPRTLTSRRRWFRTHAAGPDTRGPRSEVRFFGHPGYNTRNRSFVSLCLSPTNNYLTNILFRGGGDRELDDQKTQTGAESRSVLSESLLSKNSGVGVEGQNKKNSFEVSDDGSAGSAQKGTQNEQSHRSMPSPSMLFYLPNGSGNRNTRYQHQVTVRSEVGPRQHMEDEFVVGRDCVGIFDGHGGRAVSRYLKQNLLAEIQHATTAVARSAPAASVDKAEEEHSLPAQNATKRVRPSPLSVDDYVFALGLALEKIDLDVQKIRHWSFQGSTAVVAWLHRESSGVGGETDAQSARTPENEEREQVDDPSSLMNATTTSLPKTTLVVANIGDSRAILCRQGQAIALTRDHKPDDPEEYERITSLGGRVTFPGRHGGIPRVNGNLALSRALGDRSERPYVTATPDIFTIPLDTKSGGDDFVVLATDGLWDVMTNQEVANFVLSMLREGDARANREGDEDEEESDGYTDRAEQERKETITRFLVREALARGTYDNVTVLIVWLR